ncbi:run domain Beclin-1-interacting and cysteine-rich domain-containing protein isoform X2 [Bacillus rossius redtenbacheri]|uniref:run domain Beclin-1-interacting and cysteine-rich domain-containing protein isoform X2 n=1 Tax=Bacillus rossius redtenbacheri TaxID=93214 RepID=UPI002FDE9567
MKSQWLAAERAEMARDEVYQQEYRQLLQALKGTVEGLLISQVSNVWNVYGGLSRLQKAVERIFKHGCRVFDHHGDPDCWVFIQGLSWLRPPLAASPVFGGEGLQQREDKACAWLHDSLESHSLSQKLAWLLSDREHLLSCFERSAFLCQGAYGEATLLCLRAVEQSRPSLLTEIDPGLYLTTWKHTVFKKSHRRCSSFPEVQYVQWRSGRSECGSSAKQPSDDGRLTLPSRACVKVEESGETVSCSVDGDSRARLAREDVQVAAAPTAEAERVDKDQARLASRKGVSGEWDLRLKSWGSCPGLVQSLAGVDDGESGATPASKAVSLSRNYSVPTTPCRRMSAMEKLLPLTSPELSPSVLAVDYLSELMSDTSGSSSHEKQRSPPAKHREKDPASKMGRAPCDENGKAALLRRPSADASNDSSDTLNPDTCNVSDESHDVNRLTAEVGSHARPSELKLTTTAWDERDSSHSAGDSGIDLRKCRGVVASPATDPAREPGHLVPPAESGNRSLGKKKSFIEDGGSSVLPMATGFFPRPTEGQSLESFLSSGDFSRPSAELDRENAHFSISEAMIAAIEQVKCNRQLRLAMEEGEGEESDEEINHLKQRIRLRRRQRQEEKQRHLWGVALFSDTKTDTTTTDQSISPLSTSPGTYSDSISTDDVEDLEVDEVKNLAQLKNAGLSVSMASLYSEADLSKHHVASASPSPRGHSEGPLTESVVSAEGVALCLIRQFSDKQLPRASDLQWLVSEQEAPQQLLPMPTSWPVSPDEAEDTDTCRATQLRGTVEWAPPRPQVIFTPHLALPRRVLMAKQNYRCAGCGMKVAPEYAHRFRYCEYLGRYFCTGCHTGQLAVVPGKILAKWDFSRYPVSTFSYRLLDQMMCDPLFRVGDLNSGLYRRAKQLERVYHCRLHLFYLKDFVLTCRFADKIQESLQQQPTHLLTELDVYSLQDLLLVKSGELLARLRDLTATCLEHVARCQLCQARGFVCELCPSKEVIFPWQLGKVSRCVSCGACFHAACSGAAPCPRCARLEARRGKPPLEPAVRLA